MLISQTPSLRPEEKRRLEKKLRIILRGSQHELKKSLVRIFEDLEPRLEREAATGAVWQDLLDHMGQTEAPVDSPLADHPIAFSPAPGLWVLSDEALEALSRMRLFRSMNYLFCDLARLTGVERKAYSRWLGLERPAGWIELYRRCAALRIGQKQPDYSSLDGIDLESLFPRDELGPVFWFYKGVLPLYEAARRLDGELKEATEIQKLAIEALRTGHAVVRPRPEEFGMPQRYSICLTREKNIDLHTLPPQYTEEPLQRNLF